MAEGNRCKTFHLEKHVCTKAFGATFLVNLKTGASFLLNSSASRIFKSLQSGKSAQQIISQVAGRFRLSQQKAVREVSRFMRQLNNIGVVHKNGAAQPVASYQQKRPQANKPVIFKKSKAISFNLHQWKVRVVSDSDQYVQVLRSNFLHYFRSNGVQNTARKTLSIHVLSLNNGHNIESQLDERSWNRLMEKGFCPSIDYQKEIISIYLNPKVLNKNPLAAAFMYHGGFLYPFFELIRKFRTTLIHAALVSREGRGILIAGARGAGKSTLSVAFVKEGFQFFSEEHPIVQIEKEQVVGKSFVNKIGLVPISMQNFPELKKWAEWSPNLEKYYIDSE